METVKIIQGGMGINISNYHLARTVSILGGLGTVSGTATQIVVARILQNGDPSGDIRRALSHFPFPKHAENVIKEYFIEGGKEKYIPYKMVPFFTINPSDSLISLTICANYIIVWLAKEGHDNPISINYLEKVSLAHIYAITGAILAGVDFITVGAGMPDQISEVINCLLIGDELSYRISIINDIKVLYHKMSFNPEKFFGKKLPLMKKPGFLPIISSNLLAEILIKKLPKEIGGFIIEKPTAGGHNAPPRNKISYGEKDKVIYSKLVDLGLPFWIGGETASPEMLEWALSVGANGIQVGSIFALCKESGMNPEIRKLVRKLIFNNQLKIRTDFKISPTKYPFKVAEVQGSISEKSIYEKRKRICDIGGLRIPYQKSDGIVGYMCPADSNGIPNTGCLCNALFATSGLNNHGEPPIITLGDDLSFLIKLMKHENDSYTVKDVMNYFLKK